MFNTQIKLKKQDIIDKLEFHKKNHITEYEEAIVKYKEEKYRRASDVLTKTVHYQNFDESDPQIQANFGLTAPINNANEYNKLIKTFNMMIDEEIELDYSEASNIANDSFQWLQNAKLINSFYSNMR